jgi:uncharacterized membrane protein
MGYGIGYMAALATMIVADIAWLGFMVPRYYRPTMGDIMLSNVNLPPAIAFYALYPIGLLIFAINPALKTGSVGTAVMYGALFGFFTYATYDLTNQATLRNWTMQLSAIDIAWGTFLAAAASAVAFWAVTRFAGTA